MAPPATLVDAGGSDVTAISHVNDATRAVCHAHTEAFPIACLLCRMQDISNKRSLSCAVCYINSRWLSQVRNRHHRRIELTHVLQEVPHRKWRTIKTASDKKL